MFVRRPDALADLRLICEIVLQLNRQGFGRLRVSIGWPPSGIGALRCSVAISSLCRPSTWMFWEVIWGYDWSEPGTWKVPQDPARRDAGCIAASRGAESFLALVVGSARAARAVGDARGYDDWLEAVLQADPRLVPITSWDWYETPEVIEVRPLIADLRLPFPPGFFENNNDDWRERFDTAAAAAVTDAGTATPDIDLQ